MAFEIERKFLVKSDAWTLRASEGTPYRQGYLSSDGLSTVRVRVAGSRGFLTIKGLHEGIIRREYDYEIPHEDAEEILSFLCERPPVEKTRYVVEESGMKWEVDVFSGANRGLVMAEIELEEENQTIQLPDWVGEEVTYDNKYLNMNLYLHPFGEWLPRE